MLLAGRWWKCTYKQIHVDSRTEAHSAEALKKYLYCFCQKVFVYFRVIRVFRDQKLSIVNYQLSIL